MTHYSLFKGVDPVKFIHDVAILHLDRFIPEDMINVVPIELRQVPAKIGTICEVTGWGLTEDVSIIKDS